MLRSHKRPGFTLAEILVVIAIITVLVSLISVGVFGFIGRQHVRNSQSRVQAIHGELQARWNEVIDQARREPPSPATRALAGNDTDLAKVLWIKFRLMEAFPMSFAEIRAFALYSQPTAANPYIPAGDRKNIPSYLRKIGATGPTPGGTTENSNCLHLALSVGASNHAQKVEPYAKDPNNDTLPELLDDWGNPIVYFRFPTNHPELQAANPNSTPGGFNDPLDPRGKLVNWAGRPTFEGLAGYQVGPAGGQAYYTVPAVVSAGPDGNLGLNSPDMAVTGPADAADNIYSFKLAVGGGTGQ